VRYPFAGDLYIGPQSMVYYTQKRVGHRVVFTLLDGLLALMTIKFYRKRELKQLKCLVIA